MKSSQVKFSFQALGKKLSQKKEYLKLQKLIIALRQEHQESHPKT